MTDCLPPTPVSRAEFAAAMAALAPGRSVAVAVSGGSDSVALLWLARAWANDHGHDVVAVTVDHGLRPGSAAEANRVAGQCAALGLRHATLDWTGEKPAANLQAAARDARYRLLADWAHRTGISSILLAHTRDDQAETFMLRLARGSGADGLAAMSARIMRHGALFLRPLLDMPRLRLRATLVAAGLTWIEDPSNADPRFARARLRALMPSLVAEGLTAERLNGTARRMARVKAALDHATAALLRDAAQVHDEGYVRLALGPMSDAPEEIGLRALSRALRAVGGKDQPLRLDRLERLFALLLAGRLGGGRTLAGCRLLSQADGRILIAREAPRRPAPPVGWKPGARGIWDGRFVVSLAADAPADASVGALGSVALDESITVRVPPPVRATLPCLWIGGRPAAVPHLCYIEPGFAGAGFTADFRGLQV